MGLFDFLKKKEKIENREKVESSLPYTMSRDFNGKPLIEYKVEIPINNENITRLTIDKIEGDLADCYVCWYKEGNAIMFDKDGREAGTENILTKIDFDLLKRDPNYVRALMCELLNHTRVLKYMKRGLQAHPEVPCGKYIGSIVKREDGYGYKKVFNPNIGLMSHNSPEMIEKRRINDKETINNLKKEQKENDNIAAIASAKSREIQRKLDEYDREQ